MKKTTISICFLLLLAIIAFTGCQYTPSSLEITELGIERRDPTHRETTFKVITRVDGISIYDETIDTAFTTNGHDGDVRIDNIPIVNWRSAIKSGRTYTVTSDESCEVVIRFYWRGKTDKLSIEFI